MLTGNTFQQVTAADFFYQRAGCPLQTNSKLNSRHVNAAKLEAVLRLTTK